MHPVLREGIKALQPSLIRELANEATGSPDFGDLIQLWYGEPDLPTPEVVRRAGQDALAQGETFYTPNAGLPPLRQALADYMNGLYGTALGMERILVTGSGTLALTIAAQALLSPGRYAGDARAHLAQPERDTTAARRSRGARAFGFA